MRFDDTLAPGLRMVLSDRVDLIHSNGVPPGKDVNTLREAYLSWAPDAEAVVDVGRVNLRHGVALGFNPTDWFKENALRDIVSPDPAMLRENRQGTVVLQGQKLWSGASLTAALSPKLGTAPNADTFTLDLGATNPRNRWLVAGSYKLGEKLNPELLLYGGDDVPVQVGINVSAVLGTSTVAFVEWAGGKGRPLVAQALGQDVAKHEQQRTAIGLTYTTAFNLSITAEAERNSAAPDRAEWLALAAIDPAAQSRVLATSQALQDLPVRRAWFFHATWRDLLLRRLDLSAFVLRDAETSSRAHWFEARYRWDRADLALQWQMNSGEAGSVYGSTPQRRAVELALRFYL
jgi:hypothetical protein